MSAAEFNAIARAGARQQVLSILERRTPAGIECHWQARAERFLRPSLLDPQRTWSLFVRPGTINDRVAAISYRKSDDPRGWEPGPEHPALVAAEKTFGAGYVFADRELTEKQDPPYLLVTTPDAAGGDLGDFQRVQDRARPEFFRDEQSFEADLYRASVFVTAAPLRVSRAENRLGLPVPTRNRRFRLHVGPLPLRLVTVAAGGHFELHRVFLLRQPGQPEADQMFVQQRCFWSLWTANVAPDLFGNFDPFLPPGVFDLFNAFTDILFGEVANVLESAGSAEFWTD